MSIPTKIVALLQQYPNTVLTKKLIYERCWCEPYSRIVDNTLYVNIRLARSLLKSGRIELVKKQGYKWVP